MNRKTRIFIVLLAFSDAITFAQKTKDQIEVCHFIRYDAFPGFSYNFSGRVSTNCLKMKGLSWGINLNYKMALAPFYNLKLGVGYYRYTFNKLHNYHPPFGTGHAREVDYPSPLWTIFGTDKYRYNIISGNLGLERWFALKKNLKVITGINWNPYFTYSKSYHITYGSYGSTVNTNYVVPQKRYFGYSVNFNSGIQKRVKSFLIGPSVIIPIYDRWKKDAKFGENQEESRKKWFNGIGFGITLNTDLTF